MKAREAESRMRERECFADLKLLPGAWSIVRVDGRAFTQFTAARFEKPFDRRFADLMTTTARALMEDLRGVYACTQSDEISVVFPPHWELFDRRVEKIVSISAGIASAAFTHACGEPAHFDSRVWLGNNPEDVVEYFHWRQLDSARCALHAWCYWTLRKQGAGAEQAAEQLRGKGSAYMNELLYEQGINFNDLPVWQRRGIGLYWEIYVKAGFDPVKHEPVAATRRRLAADDALPMGTAYQEFLRHRLSGAGTPEEQRPGVG